MHFLGIVPHSMNIRKYLKVFALILLVTFKKSLKDIGIIGISQIVLSASGIILLPVISKTLGSEGYGLWSLSFVTIDLIANITALGLPLSLVRYLPAEKNKENVKEIYYSSFLLVALVNLVFAIILLIFVKPISSLLFGGHKVIFLLIIMIIPISSLISLSTNFFRGKGEMKKYSIFCIAQRLITLSLVIILLSIGVGIYGAIISVLISRITIFSITNYLIIKRIRITFPKFTKIKEMLSYGAPLISTVIFGWIVTSSDRYLISYYLDVSAAGIYSAAYSLGIIIYTLTTPVQKGLTPNLSKLYDSGNIEDVKYQLTHMLRLFLLFSIPSFFGLLAISKHALFILSRPEIAREGYLITPIVALAAIFWGSYGILYYPLILEKKTKYITLTWGIAAITNFVLNIVVIPIYGILGAAITTLIAYIVAMFVGVLYVYKFQKIDICWKYILKFLMAAISMFLVIYFYSPAGLIGLTIRIVMGGLIYFLVLYLIKGFRKEEMSFIKKKLMFLK